MVHIYRGELLPKLKATQPGKRMPVLCAVNRTLGWRILSENEEIHEKGVRTEILDINEINNENYLTSIAVSDDSGVVAIGSGNIDGALYFIKDASALKDVESGPRFKVMRKEMLGAPIHSLDWSGNHLLVGTNQGVAKIFNTTVEEDLISEFTCIGQYTNSPSQISIYVPSYSINTHVKSAEFSPNYSYHHSDDTSISNRFLTTTMNRISIWDTYQSTEPIQHYKASESSLNCANWSPNDPQSLIACGGYDKELSIIDTRSGENNGIIWSVKNAHDRPIRDCKFNPYIPYWLATAGEDSVVNIWDIRATYHAPVAKIDGLLGMATSVTWSNIRPENLGTTSSDGILRYWTLSPESFPLWDTHFKIAHYGNKDTLPITREFEEDNIWCVKGQRFRDKAPKSWIADDDGGIEQVTIRSAKLLAGAISLGEWGKPEPGSIYKGEENVPSKGTVLNPKPAKLRPSMYYCITSGGQLAAHTIRFDALSNLRNRHRFDPLDKNEIAAEIEDDIYCRRISEAERKLEILKNTTAVDQIAESHRLEEVQFLQDCLEVRDPIKFTEWKVDSLPDQFNRRVSRRLWNDEDKWDIAIQTFKTDLKYWSYRIPPGFDTKFKFPLDIKDPIIAPHLLEEKLIQTELSNFIDRSPRPSYLEVPDDISFEPLNSIEGEEGEKLGTFTSVEDSANVSGPDNLSPTMTTINSAANNNKVEQHNDQVVPVVSISGDLSSQEAVTSNNPFENQITKSQSNNPFEIMASSPVIESNTSFFEREGHVTIEEEEAGNGKRRNSWNRLSVSLSHHSHSSADSKATTSKAPLKFNPFKRYASRGSTKSEESEELSRNLLERNSSTNRRNAMHGPF